MPVDLTGFWKSNHYNHPALTDDMVTRAEDILGVRLPNSLINLLKLQNGGYTHGFIHPMKQPTSWAEDHVPLDDLAGIVLNPEHETALNLLESAHLMEEWGLPERQVLLSGDGHYWITLDYRNGPEPSVAWIDIDCGEDMQIASSFDEFLAGLLPAPIADRNAPG